MLARVLRSLSFLRLRKIFQPHQPSITGNRKARLAEQEEQQVREPRAHRPDAVVDVERVAGEREAGVVTG